MNAYQNHGTRIAVHLHHPAFGTIEFTWDASDWMVVCFHSANATTIPCINILLHTFHNKKPMTVEKNMARRIWNALVEQDGGWKPSKYIVGNPPSTIVQMAEQTLNS